MNWALNRGDLSTGRAPCRALAVGKSKKVVVQGDTMSKDQKKTIEVPVETVDNLLQTFEYITTSINFWGFKNEFPMNLVLKVCADWLYDLTVLRFPINSVKKTFKKLKNEST